MDYLESERDYVNETFENLSFPKNLEEINFRKSTFIKVDFSGCDLSTIYFEDCLFKNCIFLTTKFSKYILKRDAFIGCKMTGINIVENTLDSTEFDDCQLDFSNFSDTTLKRAKFKNCNLEESVFMSLKKVENSVFENDNMIKITFFNTSLKGVDLRTCNIGGMKVNAEDIRGLVVTNLQAVEISSLLGIIIKDIDE